MRKTILMAAIVLAGSQAAYGQGYYRVPDGTVVSGKAVPNAHARGFTRYYPPTPGVNRAGTIQGWRPYDYHNGQLRYNDVPKKVSPQLPRRRGR